MSLVIATDEAGYGPKLGPLVIVASAWELEAEEPSSRCWERETLSGDKLELADSKKLFQRSSSQSLRPLERPLVAWLADLNLDPFPSTLLEFLQFIATKDFGQLLEQAWFRELASPFPIEHAIRVCPTSVFSPECSARLVGLKARVIDAGEFNRMTDDCGNKATLLSEATVELVQEILSGTSDETTARPNPTPTYVYSDRHGGRQKYAGLLQQFFPDCLPVPVEESKSCSRYRLRIGVRTIDWRFSVQGDSFAPVAFSSMAAKYLRERMMQHFNTFWLNAHGEGLRPTAGYPLDADRFCQQIASTAKRLGLKSEQYIRSR